VLDGVQFHTNNGIVRDTMRDVANDTQFFKHSSCEGDFVFPSPEARQKEAATVLLVIPSPKGSAVRQPCSQGLRATTAPPARHPRHDESREKHPEISEYDGTLAPAGSECRAATAESVGTGFAVLNTFTGTGPYRHKMSGQGLGRIDGELLATMNRLKTEREEKERRLTAAYADRLDGNALGRLSFAPRCPSFSLGKAQGCS
jgi:hypothetical protein